MVINDIHYNLIYNGEIIENHYYLEVIAHWLSSDGHYNFQIKQSHGKFQCNIIWSEKYKNGKKILSLIFRYLKLNGEFIKEYTGSLLIKGNKFLEKILEYDIINSDIYLMYLDNISIPINKKIKLNGKFNFFINDVNHLCFFDNFIIKGNFYNWIAVGKYFNNSNPINNHAWTLVPFFFLDKTYSDDSNYVIPYNDFKKNLNGNGFSYIFKPGELKNKHISKYFDDDMQLGFDYFECLIYHISNNIVSPYIINKIIKGCEGSKWYNPILDALSKTDNIFYTPDNLKLNASILGLMDDN